MGGQKEENNNYLDENNLSNMDKKLQLKIIEENNDYAINSSEDVQYLFAKNNPLMTSFVLPKIQRVIINKNLSYLQYASIDIQIEFAKNDIHKLAHCSNYAQCIFLKNNPNFYKYCNYEVKSKVIKLNNLSEETISIDTIDLYISVNYNNISINELVKYKDKVSQAKRKDKSIICDYINHIIVNMAR